MVAGGLQNNYGTADDAVKVALMALSMIDVAQGVLSPAGIPLQVTSLYDCKMVSLTHNLKAISKPCSRALDDH